MGPFHGFPSAALKIHFQGFVDSVFFFFSLDSFFFWVAQLRLGPQYVLYFLT